MQQGGDWNFELGDPDGLGQGPSAFGKEGDAFGEQPFAGQRAGKGAGSKADKYDDGEKEEVSFDPRTGKIVVRQRRVEKVTGVKRTIDEFEKEKYAKMAEDTKVC